MTPRMADGAQQQGKTHMNTTRLALAGLLLAGAAQAADDVTLQLKWVTQAQFAGYYVAADKGFYEEEGLNVTIKPGGPDIAPPQVIAGAAPMWWWSGCPPRWRRVSAACRWSTSPSRSPRRA